MENTDGPLSGDFALDFFRALSSPGRSQWKRTGRGHELVIWNLREDEPPTVASENASVELGRKKGRAMGAEQEESPYI
eukprot:183992-Amorphochlora_amoeboformis.AAC.1